MAGSTFRGAHESGEWRKGGVAMRFSGPVRARASWALARNGRKDEKTTMRRENASRHSLPSRRHLEYSEDVMGSFIPAQYARVRHGLFPKELIMKKPRCGAKTRRGTPCQAAAIWSTRSRRFTRCKNHGGLSTGPKTAEGIERIRRAVTKHGRYSRPVGTANSAA